MEASTLGLIAVALVLAVLLLLAGPGRADVNFS
jgi:hypothetical protein